MDQGRKATLFETYKDQYCRTGKILCELCDDKIAVGDNTGNLHSHGQGKKYDGIQSLTRCAHVRRCRRVHVTFTHACLLCILLVLQTCETAGCDPGQQGVPGGGSR